MYRESPSFGTVMLRVGQLDPQFVSEHDDGTISFDLTPTGSGLHFSLVGTPDELHWLCDKLRAIVTAHESQTTLAGEAAREVVSNNVDEPFIRWANERGVSWKTLTHPEFVELRREYENATATVIR